MVASSPAGVASLIVTYWRIGPYGVTSKATASVASLICLLEETAGRSCVLFNARIAESEDCEINGKRDRNSLNPNECTLCDPQPDRNAFFGGSAMSGKHAQNLEIPRSQQLYHDW